MTTGYTPLFASLTTGTLCVRWPDVGLWQIVLSLSNRHGVVDVTPDYLSRVTGMPIDDVTACMRRFCEHDPYSRSSEEGGARLVLIDPEHRSWGWRIVNHGKYREKARKSAHDSERTESGRDSGRKRAERAASRDIPIRPDVSRDVPLSEQSNSISRDSRPQERTPVRQLHEQIIAAYHELPDLPRVKVWTKKRAQALDARIRERRKDGKPADTVGYWRSVFESVAASDFLCGRSGIFRADLEWLTKSENFAKVIEGRYDNRRGNGAAVHAR